MLLAGSHVGAGQLDSSQNDDALLGFRPREGCSISASPFLLARSPFRSQLKAGGSRFLGKPLNLSFSSRSVSLLKALLHSFGLEIETSASAPGCYQQGGLSEVSSSALARGRTPQSFLRVYFRVYFRVDIYIQISPVYVHVS